MPKFNGFMQKGFLCFGIVCQNAAYIAYIKKGHRNEVVAKKEMFDMDQRQYSDYLMLILPSNYEIVTLMSVGMLKNVFPFGEMVHGTTRILLGISVPSIVLLCY